MSDPVLDTIDHVLHDFDTSPDAMRWMPEPQPAPVNPAQAMATLVVNITPIVETYRRVFQQLARSLAKWSPRIAELKRLLAEAEANERRSAMHSEYRRRRNRR